jgi:hypothetical protein
MREQTARPATASGTQKTRLGPFDSAQGRRDDGEGSGLELWWVPSNEVMVQWLPRSLHSAARRAPSATLRAGTNRREGKNRAAPVGMTEKNAGQSRGCRIPVGILGRGLVI